MLIYSLRKNCTVSFIKILGTRSFPIARVDTHTFLSAERKKCSKLRRQLTSSINSVCGGISGSRSVVKAVRSSIKFRSYVEAATHYVRPFSGLFMGVANQCIGYRPIGRYRRSKHRKWMPSLKLLADTALRILGLTVFLSHKQAPFATGNKHTANVILKMLVVSCLEYR